MQTELKRNVAWVRDKNPILYADGIFAQTITMNPWAIVEGDTIFLFYAGDDESGRRQIRLATAPVNDPEHFTFYGVVLHNGDDFDRRWTVLPHVVKLRDERYLMIYSGNCGKGHGLAAFPGLGAAWSTDLYHWEKYEGNPVLPPAQEPGGETLIGIAGGGLLKEDLADGSYLLHLYYTGCPTYDSTNIFLHQQKAVYHAISKDGIHWERLGCVRRRTTALDYENIAAASGPVIRDPDGLYRTWSSSIGTRWGIYSITYAESEDGTHWNRGIRYGENLAFGPVVRDIDQISPTTNDWQNQSVSYPSIIQLGNELRMYYCGNGYGEGGIGCAVSTPLRLALTGHPDGEAKIWDHRHTALHPVCLARCASSAETGTLTGGVFQEGITPGSNVFFERFPETSDGQAPLSVRVMAVNKLDGIHLDLFLHNQSGHILTDVTLGLEGFGEKLPLTFSDAPFRQDGTLTTVSFGQLDIENTVCVHGWIQPI